MNSYSQFVVRVKRSEFYKEEYGYKDAWKAVKNGRKLMKEGLGTFRDAREYFLSAYKYNPDNAELNYLIGTCFLYTDSKFESIDYLAKAINKNPDVSPDIHLMLAKAYHQIQEFDKAIYEYKEFQKVMSDKELYLFKSEIDNYIAQCRTAQELVLNPKRVVINNLGQEVNSIYDEYSPVVTKDGEFMFYTTRRNYSPKDKRSPLDNKYYEDIYFSRQIDNEWKRGRRLNKKVNYNKNEKNIAVVGISNDKNKLYIYKGKENNGDIFVSEKKKGEWRTPKPFRKINTRFRETSLCFTSDEKTVYFVTTTPKYGLGGADIFYSKTDETGRWQKPKNIGNNINTKYDEIAVSLSPNDSILYFSHNGPKSMGGYDVFMSELSEVGLWSSPQNLGYPINTADDDLFYNLIEGGKYAYYSSIRERGIGSKDIYKIVFLGAEKEMLVSDKEILIAGITEPLDDIYIVPVVPLHLDTTLIMRGFISDSENKAPVVAKLEIIDVDVNQVVATSISDATGNYKVSISAPKKYGVNIIAKGYLMYLDIIDLSQETYENVIVKNFELDRVEVGAKVILQNIYFETGKSTLKTESYTSLNNVVKLLEANEGLNIEISGHTDNRGSYKSNQKLSQDRAKAVVDYLVGKGISAGRLQYKGYSYSQPIAPNTTTEGRAKNRRVEFKILSK